MAERALATAFVNIVPGTADFENYMKTKLATDVGGAGVPAGENYARSMSAGFASKVKGFFAPVLGSMALSFGAIGLTRFVGDMYDSAIEGQKVDAVLGNITSSMGLFGDKTSTVVGRLQDFATAQMKLTGVDDDIIKGGQAKLMTFAEVAKSAGEMGGTFDRATGLAMDLAAAGFGTVDSASVMLGKALQNPVKGVTALQRVGVSLTDSQKKQVEAFMKVNDVAGAQKIILDEVSRQVGGTAEASATAGEKMKARWDDAVQAMGTALLPVFDGIIGIISDTLVPAFEDASAGVKGFLGWFGDNQGWLVPVLAGIGGALAAWGIYLGIVNVMAAITAAGGMTAIIASTWAWTAALLANPITWIILGIGLLIAALVFLVLNWDKVVAWVSEVWGGFTGWLSDTFDNISKWWNDLWSGVGEFIKGAWQGIVDWFGDALQWLVDLFLNWTLLGQIIKNWDAITKAFKDAWAGITGFFKGAIDGFVKGWNDAWKGMGQFVSDTFKNIVGFVKAPMNFVIGLINKVIDSINSIKIDIPDFARNLFGGAASIGFNIPRIPALALGGYVDQPTLAMIGEAGPEVVTPLKDFERMMNNGTGNGGPHITYIAAPNDSISAEQKLVNAVQRARVLGWT